MKAEKNNDLLFSADLLIILLVLTGISVISRGADILKMTLLCCFISMLTDYMGTYIIAKRNPLKDMSALITGIMISLMLSPDAPLWTGAIASFVSVLLCRLPFSKKGVYTLPPPAVGITFISLAFPDSFYFYPAGETIIDMIEKGKPINLTPPGILNLITGNIPAAAGTACILFIAVSAVFLSIRNAAVLSSSVFFAGTVALFAVFMPRFICEPLSSLIMELSAGSLMFCAVYLQCYPGIKMKFYEGIFYGLFTAGIYIVFARLFLMPDSAPAACAVSGLFYTLTAFTPSKKRKAAANEEEKEEHGAD